MIHMVEKMPMNFFVVILILVWIRDRMRLGLTSFCRICSLASVRIWNLGTFRIDKHDILTFIKFGGGEDIVNLQLLEENQELLRPTLVVYLFSGSNFDRSGRTLSFLIDLERREEIFLLSNCCNQMLDVVMLWKNHYLESKNQCDHALLNCECWLLPKGFNTTSQLKRALAGGMNEIVENLCLEICKRKLRKKIWKKKIIISLSVSAHYIWREKKGVVTRATKEFQRINRGHKSIDPINVDLNWV